MTKRFVEVPTEAIENFLKEKGFVPEVQGREIVYAFKHLKNPSLFVKVYTSIRVGEEVARGCGSDAIRIVAIFNDGKRSFGIRKCQRVYRTGSVKLVLARLHERMQEAYGCLNEWRKKQRNN